jgi:CPA1 family monovalent cation:H+ antiporter
MSTLILYGAVFSALLILLRLLWVIPGARLTYFVRIRLLHQKEKRPTAKQVFIIGWTGMRGVVSLAAALALPVALANRAPFPKRNLIVFLTFCVIVVTLALQGITLPAVIRLLNLSGTAGPNCEELEARRIVTEAALSHLQETKARDEDANAELYDDLASHYRQRLVTIACGEVEKAEDDAHGRYVELTLETLRVERDTAIRLRDEGRINDEVLRRLERELDLNEVRLIASDN